MVQKDDCIFCRIAKGEIKSGKVGETDNFFAFLDANPLAEGHTLIIPKQHYQDLSEFPWELGNELIKFSKQISEKLKKEKNCTGFTFLNRYGKSAGQAVMHIHFHLIPRKDGDGLGF